jgi:TRAP-type mannitol/chloroaromatic compound transport system permease small subunit
MSAKHEAVSIGMLARLDRAIDWIGRTVNWLALGIVLLVATNVVLRYSASIGSVWAQELEWHFLAALILLGMSYALKYSEPIRVDIFYGRFSGIGRKRVDALTCILTLIICCLFVYLSLHYVGQSYVIDERSPDPGGLTHRWLLKALIPAGFTLLGLQTLAALARLFIVPHTTHGDEDCPHV